METKQQWMDVVTPSLNPYVDEEIYIQFHNILKYLLNSSKKIVLFVY
jgi:hypothetical protein